MDTAEQQPISVLLVEDYRLIRMGLKSVLDSTPGITVVAESTNGEQGVERVKEMKPDVTLMDIGLPGIDGIEATRQIKAFDPELKVVMLTSHDSEDEVLASLSAGANAFCLKDIEDKILVHVVETVHQGGLWIDPKIAKIAMQIFQMPEAMASSQSGPNAQETYKLSPRESEILQHIVNGRSNSEIAADLNISVHTVKAQVSQVLEKLAVCDRVQAAVKAVKENLVVH
ncbi:MAG: response regulator transcription factor [Vampirovibrio sp.]|nr:response regulator transcription factor [Vampirovibrio sp.]